jgi:hypothetical protein
MQAQKKWDAELYFHLPYADAEVRLSVIQPFAFVEDSTRSVLECRDHRSLWPLFGLKEFRKPLKMFRYDYRRPPSAVKHVMLDLTLLSYPF